MALKPLIQITLVGSLLFSVGFCFSQTQSKPPKSAPAASNPASSPDTKPPAKASDDEIIPPATPNALFPAVVARVNGKAVLGRDLEGLIRRELASIGSPEWKNLREEYRGQLVVTHLTGLINSKLLYQKAMASGTKLTDAEVQTEMAKLAKNYKSDAEFNTALASQNTDRATLEKGLYETLTISRYVEETINKKIAVTQEDLSKYYSENTAQFSHPEIVRTSHIMIRPAGDTAEQDAIAKERAEALLARAKKGEDFAKLARENSVDGSASKGGDLGFSTKEGLGAEYGEAAFSMSVGDVRVVKTQYGYHVVKVTGKKGEGLATLDEIKTELTEFLKDQKAQTELTKLVNGLRENAQIEIMVQVGQILKP